MTPRAATGFKSTRGNTQAWRDSLKKQQQQQQTAQFCKTAYRQHDLEAKKNNKTIQ